MRLDKFICACTELSRTQAKKAISNGDIFVDDASITKSSFKIDAQSKIVYLGRRLLLQGARYIMLNKPLDTVCTSIDDDARSVMGLLGAEERKALHIAGRLDIDTTGLVILTDDGAWSHRITSPKKKCGKRYRVRLIEPVSENVATCFKQGVQLNGEKNLTRPAEVEILSPYEVLLTIHEGKYHQVKRMFAALNNRVIQLHREKVGGIQLDESLGSGEWRYLTTAEISSVV